MMQKIRFTLLILGLGMLYSLQAQEIADLGNRQKAYLAILLQEAKTGESKVLIEEEYLDLASKIILLSPRAGDVSEIWNADFQSIWLDLEGGKSLKDLEKDVKFSEILEKYQFQVIEHEHNIIQLKAENFLNIPLIESEFFTLEDIKYTSLNQDFGTYIDNVSGFSISYTEGNFVLTYSSGWGDCPVGCINRAYKEYQYNPKNNTLDFIRSYGDSMAEIGD